MDAKALCSARLRSRGFRTAIRSTTQSSRQRSHSASRSRFIRPSSPPASASTIATTISRWAAWYYDLFAGQGVQHAFGTLFQLGVFDRFPKLRVVVLESQAGWIGYFLDRGDAIFNGTTLGATVRLKEKPSYYFKRQCYISADPDERTIAAMMQIVGEDKFFWATDYPHPDHPGNYLEELKGMIAPMNDSGRRGILGENVARAYQLM